MIASSVTAYSSSTTFTQVLSQVLSRTHTLSFTQSGSEKFVQSSLLSVLQPLLILGEKHNAERNGQHGGALCRDSVSHHDLAAVLVSFLEGPQPEAEDHDCRDHSKWHVRLTFALPLQLLPGSLV